MAAKDSGTPLFGDSLPKQRLPLIGRDHDLADLADIWAQPQVQRLDLSGPAGVGKSRLAIEMCRRNLLGTTDYLFVPLAQLGHAPRLAHEMVQQAGWEPNGTPYELLAESIAGRPVVFVLDNLEHLQDIELEIGKLLDAVPSARLLTTTRVRTARHDRLRYDVQPLNFSPDRPNHAVAMLLASARAHTLDEYDPTDENLRALAQRLEGLPLALELAGARLRFFTPRALNHAINEHLGVVASRSDTIDGRHQSLVAAINWSIHLLSQPAKELLLSLVPYVGGFDAEIIRGLTSDPLSALNYLDELIDSHLIRQMHHSGAPRYQLFPSVAETVSATEEYEDKLTQSRLQHAIWARGLATAARPQLVSQDVGKALELLDQEHTNLQAAIDWLIQTPSQGQLGLELSASLWRYWWIRGLAADGLNQITSVLEATNHPPSTPLLHARRAAGDLSEISGELHTAIEHLAVAEQVAVAIDNQVERAMIWNSEALVRRALGQLDQAYALHTQAFGVLEAADDEAGVLATLTGLGAVAFRRGDAAEAHTLWTKAADGYRRTGDQPGLGVTLSNLAASATALGNHAESCRVAEESLELATLMGDPLTEALSSLNLAEALLEFGEYDRARSLVERAIEVAPPESDWLRAGIKFVAAELEFHEGNLQRSGELILECVADDGAEDRVEDWANAVAHAGFIAYEAGRWTAAVELLSVADAFRKRDGGQATKIQADKESAAQQACAAKLGDEAARQASASAAEWGFAQTVAAVGELVNLLPPPSDPTVDALVDAGLSKREVEVALLLMQRLTDQEIADELVISGRTVASHVANVLAKLGISSRREVAEAVDRRLAPTIS